MKGIISELIKADILENAPVIIGLHDTDQNILWANRAYCEATGLKEEEIIGKKCWVAWGLDRVCKNCPVTTALKTGLLAQAELTPENQPHWPTSKGNWLSRAVPLKGEQGEIVGIIEVAFEISKEKAAEKGKVKEVEERFEALAEASIDALVIMDAEGRVIYWNPAAERMFGYSAAEITGKKMHEVLMPLEYREQFSRGFEHFQKTGERVVVGNPIELTAIDKSGARIPIEISVSFLKRQGKYWAIGAIRDITKRKRAEEKIFHQLKTISTLYHSAERLVGKLDSTVLAKEVVQAAVDSFDLTLAWLGRKEKDGRVILLAHYPEDITYPQEITVRWDETTEGQGPTGRAIRTGLPQVVFDIEKDPGFAPWKKVALKTGGIKSAAAFPLVSKGDTFGSLNLYASKEGFFTEEKINELTAFTHLAAGALTNAKLYEETVTRLQMITALKNIDRAITGSLDLRLVTRVALEEITKQLKVDAACILQLNPHTLTLEYLDGKGFRKRGIEETRLSLKDTTAGRVVKERKVIFIKDLANVDDRIFTTRAHLLKDEGFVSYFGAPLITKGKIIGVLEIFQREILKGNSEWIEFLETLAGQVAIALENAALINDLQSKHTELINAYNETIEGWAKALSLKEEETAEHSQRVTEMTVKIAKAMGMGEEELYYVRLGALLHDIGKIGIPDSILLKPGKLTDEEWEIMRKHPVYAFQMLAPIDYLKRAIDIPYCHHEKWDGTGYPRGLKGAEIPLAARIFAVVDVWDALISDRPYRKAWPEKEARDYIRKQSGSHFDPEVVKIFMEIF